MAGAASVHDLDCWLIPGKMLNTKLQALRTEGSQDPKFSSTGSLCNSVWSDLCATRALPNFVSPVPESNVSVPSLFPVLPQGQDPRAGPCTLPLSRHPDLSPRGFPVSRYSHWFPIMLLITLRLSNSGFLIGAGTTDISVRVSR